MLHREPVPSLSIPVNIVCNRLVLYGSNFLSLICDIYKQNMKLSFTCPVTGILKNIYLFKTWFKSTGIYVFMEGFDTPTCFNFSIIYFDQIIKMCEWQSWQYSLEYIDTTLISALQP